MADYAKLLAADGEARKYFKEAAGGAPWVDKVCDDIVAQLKAGTRYTANSKDLLAGLMTDAASALECKGFTCFRIDSGWQASYAIGDISTWSAHIAPTINEALTTMLAHNIGRFE